MRLFCLPLLMLLSQNSRAQDWPALGLYREANEKLMSSPDPGDRVVFMGNSITEFWIDQSPEFFATNDFIDRGIRGQTSPKMLLRFSADVIKLNPKAVVIMTGINDIAGNTGPSTLEMIEDNITCMAELAKLHKIKVLLCSVLPSSAFDKHPPRRIDSLNVWIKAYALKNKMTYVDYYPLFVDIDKGMKETYTGDGVHPNKSGYTLMENLLLPLIRHQVKKRRPLR